MNATKTKKVTNIRTHSHDEQIRLNAVKAMNLEEAITILRDDELVEVTPKNVRIRK